MAKPNKTNIAKVDDGKILKTNISKTSGSKTDKGQAFYANVHLNHKQSVSDVFEYDFPKYSAITAGSTDFYSQNNNKIFELYARPQLKMTFSANTGTFTSSTYMNMSHDIYKVRYSDLQRYRTTRSKQDFDSITQNMLNPLVSYSASTAATAQLYSAGTEYNFSPEQLDKPIQGFTEEIFEDRAMYFFNTRHQFSGTLNDYKEVRTIEGNRREYNNTISFKTEGDVNKVTSGPFNGLTVRGMYFVCFYPPSMPVMEDPRPETYSAETFTPEFFFSNVSDGDRYVVEITYQSANSGFTIFSATSQYFFLKEETNNFSTERVANKEETSFISQTTRRASVPLIPNNAYWYRVGNIKEIIDLFDVRHQIITYTEPASAFSYSSQTVSHIIDSTATSGGAEISPGGRGTQGTDYPLLLPEK